MKKRISGLLALFLILALTVQPVFAANEISVIKVGSKEAYNAGTETDIYTFNKKENISITTTDAVYYVHIDGPATDHDVWTKTVSGATYTFTYSEYDFGTTGKRSFTVTPYALNLSPLTGVAQFDVYYYEQDMFYRNENAFKSGNVTALDKGITIALGKSNYFKDSTNLSTGDSVIQITAQPNRNEPNSSAALNYYSCVSPVYEITPGDTDSRRTSKPVTLTLKIDDGVPPAQYSKLCIVRSNNNFATVELLGGVSNSSKKTITSDPIYDLPNYRYTVMLYNRAIDANWAEFSVTPLVAKGAINTTIVDSNLLSTATNRANFAKMIVKGMGIPLLPELPASSVFTDITAASVPDPNDRLIIETAASYGIMRGDTNNMFRPGDTLTRQEAAAVLANAAKLKIMDDKTIVDAGLKKLYVDFASISSWAGPAVMAVSQAKLMMGSPVNADDPKQGKNFLPTSNLTYLESATMVYNLMKKNKRI